MSKMVLGVFVLLLGINVGCGPDETTATQSQNLTGCTMHHPVTWTVAGHTCVESQNVTQDTFVEDGDVVQIFAVPYASFGEGSATFQCDVAFGGIRQTSANCTPFNGSGQ